MLAIFSFLAVFSHLFKSLNQHLIMCIEGAEIVVDINHLWNEYLGVPEIRVSSF